MSLQLLLLGELGCVNCHKADAAPAGSLTHRQGPVLDKVGARVTRGFLRKFLTDPHAVSCSTYRPTRRTCSRRPG